jgi:hypothetical protein
MSLFIGKQNTHEVANSKIELTNELQVKQLIPSLIIGIDEMGRVII